MKYLIYTRVSPKGSDWIGEETTVTDQAAQCSAYIKATDPNAEIIDTITDEFESGGSSKRPGWQRILSELKSGSAPWDVLVVRHLDRFSRSISDAVNVLELMHNSGKHLIATAQGLNSSNPSGRGVINILLSIAQMEREFASERTRLKMHSIAAKGLWPVGRPPYGYRRGEKHDNKLYIDEEKSLIVKEIFRRYKSGKGPSELARDYEIDKNTVLHILRNRAYLGLISYDGKEYRGKHRAIISPKLFDAVQNEFPKSSCAPRPRSQKYPYLLTGLVHCDCGYHMTPASANGRSKRYHYYQCTDSLNCKSRVSAEELEECVIDTLRKVSFAEEDLADILKGARMKHLEGTSLEAELSQWKEKLEYASSEVERLTQMFADGLVTSDNAPAINSKLSSATARVNEATGRIDALSSLSYDPNSDLVELAKSLSSVSERVDQCKNSDDYRSLIATWVGRIKKAGDEWEINLNIPGSPNCEKWLPLLGLDEPISVGRWGKMSIFWAA